MQHQIADAVTILTRSPPNLFIRELSQAVTDAIQSAGQLRAQLPTDGLSKCDFHDPLPPSIAFLDAYSLVYVPRPFLLQASLHGTRFWTQLVATKSYMGYR